MAMPSLTARKPIESPADEEEFGGNEDFQPPVLDAVETSVSEAAQERDEFDVAAEVVQDSSGSEAAAEAAPEENKEENEEEAAKTADDIAMESFRRETGASEEQARSWLAASKAAAPAAQAPQAPQRGQEQDQERQDGRQQRPPHQNALGASIAGIGAGVAGGLGAGARSIKRGVADAANAALRGTKLKPTAGLTPERMKNRLFAGWHADYEAGVNGMARSSADLVKTAAAYNQLVKTSAPGRELEKIAKSRGTDIKTLLSEVVDGSFEDADAKAAVATLQQNPHVQRAWSNFEQSVNAYRDSQEQVQHNLTQLVNNNSGKVDLTVESARLGEIARKHNGVEQPLELPANPISTETKANGKSSQRDAWEQFLEMSQKGLSFLSGLFEKVATFIASKFGGGNGGGEGAAAPKR
jgi:hypothetical protein